MQAYHLSQITNPFKVCKMLYKKVTSKHICLLFLSGLFVSCANAQDTIPYGFKFADENGPVVRVRLDADLNAKAIIDTGSSFCLIRNNLAEALNKSYKSNKGIDILAFGDSEAVKLVGDFQVGVLENNYSRMQRCYTPSLEKGVSAIDSVFANADLEIILGLDFFEGTEFTIDGPSSIIKIENIDPSIENLPTIELGAAPQLQNLFHRVEIDNESFSMALDSGFLFHSTLAFFQSATERLEVRSISKPYDHIGFPEFSTEPMRRSVRDVKFSPNRSNVTSRSLIIYDGKYVQRSTKGYLKNDGHLGWGIMKRGVSKFDLIGQPEDWTSHFELSNAIPVKYNLSGIAGLRINIEGNYEIAGFQRISPARESGFRTGDKIIEMNGFAVNSEGFSHELRRKIFRGDLGLKIPVKFIRDEEVMELDLILKHYLE